MGMMAYILFSGPKGTGESNFREVFDSLPEAIEAADKRATEGEECDVHEMCSGVEYMAGYGDEDE